MKKIFLFTVLCLVGGTAFAQKKNVSRANNELKQEKPNMKRLVSYSKRREKIPKLKMMLKHGGYRQRSKMLFSSRMIKNVLPTSRTMMLPCIRLWKMSMHIFNKPFIWIRFLMQKIKFRPNTLKESLVVYMIDI